MGGIGALGAVTEFVDVGLIPGAYAGAAYHGVKRAMAMRRKSAVRKTVTTKYGRPKNSFDRVRAAARKMSLPKPDGRRGTKRSSSAAADRSKRRKSTRRTGATGSMATYMNAGKVTIGKYRRPTFKKYLKITGCNQTYRFQGVNRLNDVVVTRDANGLVTSVDGAGYFQLTNLTSLNDQPLHAYCMNVDPIRNGAVNHVLSINAAGEVGWGTRIAQSNTGVGGANRYYLEYQNKVPVPQNHRYIRFNWYDIRLCLYGCSAQPAIYDIYVCKFTRDELVPVVGAAANEVRDSFWQNMIKPAVYHPMLPTVKGSLKGMRVLKHRRINIPAASNDDLDQAPASVQLRMFVRDGRNYDFAWNADRQVAKADIEGFGWAIRGDGIAEYKDRPRPKAQMYLVIRASNTIGEEGTAITNMNCPKYDLVLRTGISVAN